MKRVLPRDAFNDANLLKCVGKMCLLIHEGEIDWITFEYDGEPFDIQQDAGSGATEVMNVKFHLLDGRCLHMTRPINSREPWPVYLDTGDWEDVPAFDDSGNFIATKSDFWGPR